MIRAIDLAGRPTVPPQPQAAPQLQWLDIADLVIDDTYQRPLGPGNWAAIKRIAENFRWSRFSPVLVAPIPGGKFAIVDGQHRAHAALMCGFDKVPAMSVPMDPQEQAGAFTWVNGQVTAVSPLQVYKAALAAREGWAVRFCEVVEAADCQLMTANWSTATKKPGMIFCIALIKKHVQGGTGWAVTAGLKAIRAYDVKERVGLYSDYILSPWLAAVASDRAFLAADLSAVLIRHDPFLVIEKANRIFGGENGRASVPDKVRSFEVLIRQNLEAAA